jgi:hypothetical protein
MSDVWKPFRDLWQELGDDLARERSRLQNAALHTGRAFLQDVVRIAGESLLDQISRLGRTAGDSRKRLTRFE